tara:strand:+ start:1914 stop:2387 length:474 start_codon:yes stop_codon:yes gene_type:complete
MKQKRKGLTKPRHSAFNKEYSFEIKVVILFTLGIFLLVEDLEIKQYIFEFIRLILFSIGNGIKWLRDSILFLVKQFEVSDIVGISLILYVVYLIANRWRDRMIERYLDLDLCPKCGTPEMHRIKKDWNHKLLGVLYFVSVKHYQCKKCSHKEIKLVK